MNWKSGRVIVMEHKHKMQKVLNEIKNLLEVNNRVSHPGDCPAAVYGHCYLCLNMHLVQLHLDAGCNKAEGDLWPNHQKNNDLGQK